VFTGFLSPANPGHSIWGVGPVIQAPTHTNGLGNKSWGMGASFVVLQVEHGDPSLGSCARNRSSCLRSDDGGHRAS